ncbi:MAG: LuxR C-terminal-related transcriptional regulator [Pseudonocardiales bacterium]
MVDQLKAEEITDHWLSSKIEVPELPGWVVSRPRLTARIGKGVRSLLTVVTGVPGAGKTVAVASWVASLENTATPITVAWVSADDGDCDPDLFWGYLLAALRRAGVDLPPAVGAPFGTDGIDHVRIAELASVLTRREHLVVLVLDDFRPAVGSTLVAAMAYLLKLARFRLRLVIISRRDLPLPLHRYRLTGDLAEIDSDDLAFTELEADELMAQHNVVLRRESVRVLLERTEGWAAGLRLAAMSMDGHPAPDELVKHITSGEHAIAGYLIEEVLDAQPPTVRRLLLTTSILDRVNAEIAAELTVGAEGTEFSVLVGQNAFIRPLGHGWYRYHHMFQNVLRLRLQHENPGQTAVLHRRAAAWFSAQGLLTEAVQHATAAHDWQLASTLVVNRLAVGDLLGLRPAPLLTAALGPMPALVAGGVVTDLEPALVAAALALGCADEQGYRSALGQGMQILGERPQDDAKTARLTAALLRLVHARGYHETCAGEATADVEMLLEPIQYELLDQRPDLRSLALVGRAGNEMWAGQWTQAADSFAAAHAAAVEADSTVLRFDCLAHSALVEVLRGRWECAAELAGRAALLASMPTSPISQGGAALRVAQGWIALQRYQLADARRVLDQTDPALLESHPWTAAVRELVSAQIAIAQGHDHRAVETLRSRRAARSIPSWLVRRMMLTESQAHTGMGAPIAAWQAAIRAGGTHTADGAVALARAQLSAGHPAAAVGTLRPTLAEAVTVRSDVRVEAWLLDAQSCYATGDPARGRRSLDRALRLGDRERVRLPFAGCQSWLRSVLGSDQDLARQYARLLEPLRIGVVQCDEHGGPPEQAPLLSGKLSDRELEVLQHLAQMRTSEEIATEMFVSINTVKTHLKSIYRKLAVTRRGDAVRRAHQLELLAGAPVSAMFAAPPPGNGHSRPNSRARRMAALRDETPSLR